MPTEREKIASVCPLRQTVLDQCRRYDVSMECPLHHGSLQSIYRFYLRFVLQEVRLFELNFGAKLSVCVDFKSRALRAETPERCWTSHGESPNFDLLRNKGEGFGVGVGTEAFQGAGYKVLPIGNKDGAARKLLIGPGLFVVFRDFLELQVPRSRNFALKVISQFGHPDVLGNFAI